MTMNVNVTSKNATTAGGQLFIYIYDWIWLADRATVKRHSPAAPVNYLISICPNETKLKATK